MSHTQQILQALRDGQWHTTHDLYLRLGPMILHSRISDLRHQGHQIQGEHVPGQTGAHGYQYRLLWEADKPRRPVDTPLVPAAEQLTLTHYDI